MNKQGLIDKAVHELGWVYEKSSCGGNDVENYLWDIGDDLYQRLNRPLGFLGDFVCTKGEFQQRAKELGYINGYRYGVEYPTNGERPTLPDDTLVSVKDKHWLHGHEQIGAWEWSLLKTFKILDQRYKPADTSYLDKSGSLFCNDAYLARQVADEKLRKDGTANLEELEAGNLNVPKRNSTEVSKTTESKSKPENVSDWFDYEAQKAVALPPVGLICEARAASLDEFVKVKVLNAETNRKELAVASINGCIFSRLFWAFEFRPLDHNRKAEAEAEKKRVVDAASAHCDHINPAVIADLYDAGFLRMPEGK